MSRTHPGGSYPKLSRGTVFTTVRPHAFTLAWFRKTYVIVETFHLTFHVFMWALLFIFLMRVVFLCYPVKFIRYNTSKAAMSNKPEKLALESYIREKLHKEIITE